MDAAAAELAPDLGVAEADVRAIVESITDLHDDEIPAEIATDGIDAHVRAVPAETSPPTAGSPPGCPGEPTVPVNGHPPQRGPETGPRRRADRDPTP
jgi:hypothetical protein